MTITATKVYTGGNQTFVVPAGVTSLVVECWGAGAASGGVAFGAPGKGGYVKGTLPVTPGETLHIAVGLSSQIGAPGNGYSGGAGGVQGGGASSDVRRGGTALANRILVAGGGGAGGEAYGGATPTVGGDGGGLVGQSGQALTGGDVAAQPATTGGSQVSGGTGQQAVGSSNGAKLGDGGWGQDGGDFLGSALAKLDGGGGGGGYYGGGGGFANLVVSVFKPAAAGSGAGGSSYISSDFTDTTNTQGVRSGNGQVVITYSGPPLAPTLLQPIGGTSLDRALGHRFSWTFNDDPGETQAAYEWRYRIVGAPTWTSTTASSPNAFRDVAAGLFAGTGPVDYEWQVRTSDQGAYGPFSSSGFFTVDDQPPGPVITAPTNGSSIPVGTVLLEWSSSDQDAYEVRSVADLAGAPVTGTVLYSSGVVELAGLRAHTIPLPVNGRTEHLQVRTRDAGLWSPWSSVMVTADFTEPPIPTVSVLAAPADARIAVTVSNPTPVGSEPAIAYVEVWRRPTGTTGDGGRPLPQPAVAVPPNSTFLDRTVDNRTDYEYRAKAVGANGTSSWSTWDAGNVDPDAGLYDAGLYDTALYG